MLFLKRIGCRYFLTIPIFFKDKHNQLMKLYESTRAIIVQRKLSHLSVNFLNQSNLTRLALKLRIKKIARSKRQIPYLIPARFATKKAWHSLIANSSQRRAKRFPPLSREYFPWTMRRISMVVITGK